MSFILRTLLWQINDDDELPYVAVAYFIYELETKSGKISPRDIPARAVLPVSPRCSHDKPLQSEAKSPVLPTTARVGLPYSANIDKQEIRANTHKTRDSSSKNSAF